jgi:hypothetical protein
MALVDEDQFNSSLGWAHPNCECLPGCNELSYVSSMTFGHIDPLFAVNKSYLEHTDITDMEQIR